MQCDPRFVPHDPSARRAHRTEFRSSKRKGHGWQWLAIAERAHQLHQLVVVHDAVSEAPIR
jgi:hypothetical protein